MKPERIEKVKSLAAAALARPLHERNAYLAGACGNDDSLRRDVETFLNDSDRTEQFFYRGETARLTNDISDAATEEFSGGLPTDPRIGKIFGKYIIQKRLAEGGMGIVYVALDTQLGREVALKVLPEFFSRDRERLQRFQREAQAISLLNHPNIVTIFEIGHLEGCEFLVTEFVEGETLRERMQRASIPFVEVLKIAMQVAGALSAAHKAGIIHRDIKPENVMLRPDGYVKVLDFGLAKLTDATRISISGDVPASQRSFNRTMPGTIMGTAAYMSPEQAEGGEVDVRTDIWGLGVLLYELVSGKLPFEGPTASHTIVAILEQEPEKIKHATPELQQIIATALQKNKELRYQTADAMSGALDGLKHKLGYVSDQNIAGHTVVPLKAAVPAGPSPYRKLVWLVPAAFAALLIFAGGLYGVMAWFLAPPVVDDSRLPVVTSQTPMPAATIESTPTHGLPTPSPTASPAIYVEPTPKPTPEPTPEKPDVPESSDPAPRRQRPRAEPVAQPVRTVKQAEARKPPRKVKPQDPNCVFTNSCH